MKKTRSEGSLASAPEEMVPPAGDVPASASGDDGAAASKEVQTGGTIPPANSLPSQRKPRVSVGVSILLSLLVWVLILVLCIVYGSGDLSLSFETPPEPGTLTVRFDPEGIVAVSGTALSEDGLETEIRFNALSQGVTETAVFWDGLPEDSLYAGEILMTLRSLPFGIVQDSLTGNFTGWEYLIVCLPGCFLTIAVILYLASLREKKLSCFSYRSIRLFGLAIFFFVLAVLRLPDLLNLLNGKNPGTVWSLLVGLISSAQTFMRRSAYVIGAFAAVMAVSNIFLLVHEGFRPANMLGIAAAILIIGGAFLGIRLSNSHYTFSMRNILCNVYAGLFVYFECLLTATVIRAFEAGRHQPDYDKDYVIILGCRIRPDGSLYPLIRGRVERALSFASAQAAATGKRAILVPSGGQGSDEPLSESEAMAAYLVEKGVPPDEIMTENRSQTTRENLQFSRSLITEKKNDARVAFSTSSYHVCRGGILAEEMGWNIDGMGSHTKWYFWPNAFLREFVGLLSESRWQQLTAVLVISLLSAALTLLI